MFVEEHGRARRQLGVLIATYACIALRQRGSAWTLFLLVTLGAGLGVGVAFAVSMGADIASTSLMVITFTMIVTLGSLWSSASSLISPPDARFISAQPVSPRTYFAARSVSAVLVAWFWITVVLWPVFVAVASDNGIRIVAAMALAAYLGAATLTLYVLIGQLYLLLKLRGQLVSIVTAVFFVVLAIGMMSLIGIAVDETGSMHMAATASWASVASPAAWFAAWPRLVAGDVTPVGLGGAVLAAVAVVVAICALASEAPGRYVDRVTELRTDHGTSIEAGWSVPAWNEWYVTAQLVLAALRRDAIVTTAVLMPTMVLLLSMVVGWGSPRLHEFSGPVPPGPHPLWYLTFGFICVPMAARWTLVASETHHAASWIFDATPVRRSRILLAFNVCVLVIAAIPATLLAGIVLWHANVSGARILLHLITCILLAFILLQVYTVFDLSPPLSQPSRGRGAARRALLFLGMFVGAFLLASVAEVVHRSPYSRLPLLCLAVVVSVGFVMVRATPTASGRG